MLLPPKLNSKLQDDAPKDKAKAYRKTGLLIAGEVADATRSAPRNIAEGFGRFRHREFAQFVRVAKGSEAEVLNHFIDARDLRLMSDDEFIHAEHTARRALKAANGLIRYLESTPDPPPPPYKPKPPKDPST